MAYADLHSLAGDNLNNSISLHEAVQVFRASREVFLFVPSSSEAHMIKVSERPLQWLLSGCEHPPKGGLTFPVLSFFPPLCSGKLLASNSLPNKGFKLWGGGMLYLLYFNLLLISFYSFLKRCYIFNIVMLHFIVTLTPFDFSKIN